MKTLVKSLLAVLAIVTIASCSKEVSQETGANVVTGSNFTANINGESWKADSLEQVVVGDSIVSITGLSGSKQEISLELPNFAVGKYSLNASTAAYAMYTSLATATSDVYLTNSSVEVSKASGTVEITAIDTLNKTVTGTFSFTAYRTSDQTTVSVTSGVFKALAYSVSGTGGGGVDSAIADNGRDTLSAFVDGNFFVTDPATIGGTTSDFGNGPIVVLIGTRSTQDPEGFTLTLPSDITPGTHTLSYPSGTAQILYLFNSSDYYVPNGNDGVVKILSNDQTNKRITGQFSFVGGLVPTFDPTKKITGGYFGISYQ